MEKEGFASLLLSPCRYRKGGGEGSCDSQEWMESEGGGGGGEKKGGAMVLSTTHRLTVKGREGKVEERERGGAGEDKGSGS